MKTDSKKNQQKQQRLETIEANLDGYPKVGSILASDGTSGHAIGLINGWIFDSNLPHAIATTKANLDWCSSAENDTSEFKGFHESYLYIKRSKMGVSAAMIKNGPLLKQHIYPSKKTKVDHATYQLLMTDTNEYNKRKKSKNKNKARSRKSKEEKIKMTVKKAKSDHPAEVTRSATYSNPEILLI